MKARLLPLLENTPLVMPTRSRLFNLPPIGQHTWAQESLLSYIHRLAAAHLLAPIDLVHREILPLTHISYVEYGNSSAFARSHARTIDSQNVYARQFVLALSKLTLRDDLEYLTLLRWREPFSPGGRGVMAPFPRWCNACFKEMRARQIPIYRMLLWSMAQASYCPRHQAALENECPHCGEHQAAISKHSILNRCSSCRRQLEGGVHRSKHRQREFGEFEHFATREVGYLVAANPDPELFTHACFRSQLIGLAAATGLTLTTLARRLGMDRKMVRNWRSGRSRPRLSQFLKFCFRLGIRPSEFFEISWHQRSLAITKRYPPPVYKPRPRRTIAQLHKARAKLRSLIEAPPLRCTVLDAVRLTGFSRSTLFYRFPKEMVDLTQKLREVRHAKAVENQVAYARAGRDVVDAILSAGLYVTNRRLEHGLKQHRLSLLNPTARKAARHAKFNYISNVRLHRDNMQAGLH